MSDKKRIDWIDTFKGLGIFAIYLGHNGTAAGKLYPFVFTYHVALFFFVAGFSPVSKKMNRCGNSSRNRSFDW